MSPSPRDIPDAELEILAALWRRREATVRELREDLRARRPMTHGAALALVRRLEDKGLVRRTGKKVGKAHVYRPAVRPARTYRARVRDLLERLFSGDSVALVHSLFETRPPDDDEIEALQRLLDDMRARRARR